MLLMRRKTIQLAHKTLVISLPAKWVKRCEIKKGDELDVEQNKNELKISLPKPQIKKSKTINADVWGRLLSRYLVSLYHQGFSEFEIRYDAPEMLKRIQTATAHMIGFEMVKQTKNFVVIRDITGPSDEEFSTILRRLFLLVLDVFQDGIEAIKTDDKKQIQTLILKDVEINKFSHFCLRKINKGDVKEEQKARIYFTTCILLEKIGDDLKSVLTEKRINTKQLNEILHLFRLCYELAITPEPKKALEIANVYDELNAQNVHPKLKALTESIIFLQNNYLSLA